MHKPNHWVRKGGKRVKKKLLRPHPYNNLRIGHGTGARATTPWPWIENLLLPRVPVKRGVSVQPSIEAVYRITDWKGGNWTILNVDMAGLYIWPITLLKTGHVKAVWTCDSECGSQDPQDQSPVAWMALSRVGSQQCQLYRNQELSGCVKVRSKIVRVSSTIATMLSPSFASSSPSLPCPCKRLI